MINQEQIIKQTTTITQLKMKIELLRDNPAIKILEKINGDILK